MKKLLFVLLLLLMQSITIFAQDGKASLVTPGKGIGEITIGMPYTKVVEILGTPFQKRAAGQEKDELIKRNLNPNREVRFFIGFDYVAEYNTSSNHTEYPIYSLYFKDEVLVYMTLSSYNYDLEKCKKFGINSALFFGDNKEKMRKALGKSSIILDTKTDTLLYDYLDKGVSLFCQGNEIRSIYLYAPFNRDQIKSYLKDVNGK